MLLKGNMSRRGNKLGNRGGAVSPRWLVLLGIVSGCSEPVSSVTTVSSLLPDEPTSPYASSATGEVDAAADDTTPNFESFPTSDAVTGGTTGANSDGPSASPDTDSWEGASSAPEASQLQEAGVPSGVNVVDGHLPELSPREDANLCGIAVDNGPPLCDPVARCGCEADQTCAFTPDRVRLFTCVSPGDTADGAECDHDDACKSGSVCTNGLCAATCRLDSDCGADKCVTVSTAMGVVENLRVCVAPCDPLDAAACGAGATCANAPGTATFTCQRQATAGTVDAACETSSDCAPGLGCALDGVCRAWCSLEAELGLLADAGSVVGVALEVGVCPEYSECLAFDPQGGLGLCGASCPVPEVPGSECSLVPTTCGCSDDETCQVDISGKTQCAPPGEHTAMEWCTRNSDCAAGLSCVGSLCRPICDAELLPCADGSGCVQASSAENSPSTCLGHCDPVLPTLDDDEFTPCGTGAYCSPGLTGDEVLAASYCARQSDTPAKEGAACASDFQCKNGFGCDPETDTCQAWCRETEDCAAGKTCDLNVSPSRGAGTADPVGLCR